ncbi:MAG: aldehyde dehydrogenase family protein [Phycisphaeraceae bacterium]|nr:MAG: aldehyde dehydrogenase family protein [Phycisphaeraceae bacterium]
MPTHHPSLQRGPADLIGGRWLDPPSGASPLVSRNPADPSRAVWAGGGDPARVDVAVSAARGALDEWSGWSFERRAGVLRAFQAVAAERASRLADLIRDEVGKVAWDAQAEAGLLGSKVDITLDAGETGPLRRVTGFSTPLAATREGRCWYRPHGVMAVVGPYNFPAHLPNGHIVPALAMGNTVVLKPSDKAPAVGQFLGELYKDALDACGAPPGVVNVVQGGAESAKRLASHGGIDGVLFTGSWPVGRSIMQANLDRPGRILALEMGGNNAAVVMPDADLRQAAVECVRSAFITTGQRCTCTRRVIVHRDVAARFIPALAKAASALIIGPPDAAHPVFMGPLIGEAARAAVLDAQTSLARAGGDVMIEARALDRPGWYISPGLMRVERFLAEDGGAGADAEVFGPFLRVSVAADEGDAMEQANATRFGLAASIFTKDAGAVERFLRRARAGCVNVNTGTAGASSKLPFGGLGLSGNHRPAGAFSLDYCAYPVAGMIESSGAAPLPVGMLFDDAWLG